MSDRYKVLLLSGVFRHECRRAGHGFRPSADGRPVSVSGQVVITICPWVDVWMTDMVALLSPA